MYRRSPVRNLCSQFWVGVGCTTATEMEVCSRFSEELAQKICCIDSRTSDTAVCFAKTLPLTWHCLGDHKSEWRKGQCSRPHTSFWKRIVVNSEVKMQQVGHRCDMWELPLSKPYAPRYKFHLSNPGSFNTFSSVDSLSSTKCSSAPIPLSSCSICGAQL